MNEDMEAFIAEWRTASIAASARLLLRVEQRIRDAWSYGPDAVRTAIANTIREEMKAGESDG